MNFHQVELRATTNKSAGEYFPNFDYLRFLLALAVVAYHTGALTWEHSGNFPVQIFFALSGWLIGGILLGCTAEDLPKFYFNRAARIWVPYFVTLSLLVVAYLIFTRAISGRWLEGTFYKLTFVYNFFGIRHAASQTEWNGNHLWSICAEEQFYLVAPLLIVLFPQGRRLWFWCILTIAVLLSAASEFFGAICLGVTASIVQANYFPNWHCRPIAICVNAVGAAVLFVGIYFEAVPYFAGSAISSILIVLALAQPGRSYGRVAAFAGGMSYSLYLNHWIGVWMADQFAKRISLAHPIYHSVALALSIAVAAALYALIDKPVHRHRAEHFCPRRGLILASAGYALVSVGIITGLVFSN